MVTDLAVEREGKGEEWGGGKNVERGRVVCRRERVRALDRAMGTRRRRNDHTRQLFWGRARRGSTLTPRTRCVHLFDRGGKEGTVGWVATSSMVVAAVGHGRGG